MSHPSLVNRLVQKHVPTESFKEARLKACPIPVLKISQTKSMSQTIFVRDAVQKHDSIEAFKKGLYKTICNQRLVIKPAKKHIPPEYFNEAYPKACPIRVF